MICASYSNRTYLSDLSPPKCRQDAKIALILAPERPLSNTIVWPICATFAVILAEVCATHRRIDVYYQQVTILDANVK